MKLLIALVFVTLATALLFVGYYEKMEDAYPEKVFFIKKHPTLKLSFVNIFAYESDDKTLSQLNNEERQQVIDYCWHRLGISTQLASQQELEECKRR